MSTFGGDAIPDMSVLYFCHECNRTVSITPSDDIFCPNCNGDFLEELDGPNPTPSTNPVLPEFGTGGVDPFSLLFSPLGGNLSGGGGPLFDHISSSLFGSVAPGTRSASQSQSQSESQLFQDAQGFNPLVYFQNYLQTLRASGADIQFVIDNNSGSGSESEPFPGLRLPGNLGDYFVGPGLEQLIQQLAENDPNRYGTPPASKSAVDGLPTIKVSAELLDSDSWQCAVCKDMFELDEEGRQMPCKHIYHTDCIMPWLELHNSCPVCRYELPTDDADYEQRARDAPPRANRNVAAQSGASGDNIGQGGNSAADIAYGEVPHIVDPRLRISLPRPFSEFGASAEGSNSRSGNSGGSEDTYAGSRENRNFGSETRQEDLD